MVKVGVKAAFRASVLVTEAGLQLLRLLQVLLLLLELVSVTSAGNRGTCAKIVLKRLQEVEIRNRGKKRKRRREHFFGATGQQVGPCRRHLPFASAGLVYSRLASEKQWLLFCNTGMSS